MKQRRRIYYSAVQRSEIWDRWQAGESMSSIGRRFNRESSSVFSLISPTGGIRPPVRRRAKRTLTLSEREEISRWLSMRCSLRAIARHLGRSASTVRREVSRNGERTATDQLGRIRLPGIGLGVPSFASWPVTRSWRRTVDWAKATMVAGTNSWLAQAYISGTKSGVTRD